MGEILTVEMSLEIPIGGPVVDAGYSARQAAEASVKFESSKRRDPHTVPDFSDSNPQTSPLLFLPPLLSSLPHGLSHTPAPSPDQPPLSTETHLPNIDPASLSLHRALHYFSPLHPNYATQEYAESFNWATMSLPEDDEREWYVVAFKSKRKPGSDSGRECTILSQSMFSQCTDSMSSVIQCCTKLIEEPTKRPFRTVG